MHIHSLEKFYLLPMIEVKPLNGVRSLTYARGCEYHRFVMGNIGFEPKRASPCRSKKISYG
jgi:hypothetical protein